MTIYTKLSTPSAAAGMTIRRITLADGRYMIFYAFSKELLKLSDKAKASHETEASPSRQTEQGSGV
jgi:hypothetical protein